MYQLKLVICLMVFTGLSSLCGALQMDVDLSKAEKPTVAPILQVDETEKTTLANSITTAKPTSTTTKDTTTTTTTTTSTTAAPTVPPTTEVPSTSEPPKTTTPAPAPYPEPSVGFWNSTCIMVKMATQLNFTYETKDDKTATTLYNIPIDAKVEDSHCDSEKTQFLQINWGPNTAQHTMLLQFDMNNKTTELSMITFTLPLMSDRFPDAKDNQTIQLIHRGNEFSAPLKMSYHCTRAQFLNLTEIVSNNKTMGTASIRNVQVEAFRNANSTAGFSTARDCDSSATSDIVPIAVGIALAALISIVLISYLCARRRSTSRGYMSF